MQVHRNKKIRKKTLIIILLAIALLAALSVYIVPLNGSLFGWRLNTPIESEDRKVNDTNYDKPTTDELKIGQDIKSDSLKNEGEKPSSSEQQTKNTVSVTLTAANVYDGIVQIRALITPSVSDATCELQLKQGSTSKLYTTKTQALSSSSTCQGFNVPATDLGAGVWSILITVKDGQSSLGSVAGEVTIDD